MTSSYPGHSSVNNLHLALCLIVAVGLCVFAPTAWADPVELDRESAHKLVASLKPGDIIVEYSPGSPEWTSKIIVRRVRSTRLLDDGGYVWPMIERDLLLLSETTSDSLGISASSACASLEEWKLDGRFQKDPKEVVGQVFIDPRDIYVLDRKASRLRHIGLGNPMQDQIVSDPETLDISAEVLAKLQSCDAEIKKRPEKIIDEKEWAEARVVEPDEALLVAAPLPFTTKLPCESVAPGEKKPHEHLSLFIDSVWNEGWAVGMDYQASYVFLSNGKYVSLDQGSCSSDKKARAHSFATVGRWTIDDGVLSIHAKHEWFDSATRCDEYVGDRGGTFLVPGKPEIRSIDKKMTVRLFIKTGDENAKDVELKFNSETFEAEFKQAGIDHRALVIGKKRFYTPANNMGVGYFLDEGGALPDPMKKYLGCR